MKESGKDIGCKVLQDFRNAEETPRACEDPSRVREGWIYLGSFSRLSQIELALTRWNDDITAVTLSAKTIYRALKQLAHVELLTKNTVG